MDEQWFFEEHPNPMLICAKESMRILKVNHQFCKTYNFTVPEIEQREVLFGDLHNPVSSGEIDRNQKGERAPFSSKIWKRSSDTNGTHFMKVASTKVTYKDEEAHLVSLTDVTPQVCGQQQARQKTRRHEQLFKKLFTDAPQAMVMVNPENKVQEVNKSFEKLFGYKARELHGNDLNKTIKAGEGYKEAPKIPEIVSRDGHIYPELKRYAKDGTELHVVVGEIPVYLDGELIAGFGIYIDISNQKDMQRQLQKSLDEKQVLLEEVHHRVKNNLAVVSGLLQMQTMHVNDPRLSKYIQNSQLRIQSMAIVHEMLYKSESASEIKMRAYLNKLVDVISETLSPPDKEVNTVTQSDHITLNVNQAIPCALVVSELITNAYEFAFEGRKEGKIEVSLLEDEGAVLASVVDNGIGLPENFDEMRKKSLGISLMENLCAQLETGIKIESGDWGTQFKFMFQKKDTKGSSSSNRI